MSFLGNKELEPLLRVSISDNKFDPERMQNASYELTLGDEVYTNSDNKKTLLTKENPQFEIKPGQFAILITKEEIQIPNENIGFISLKFGFKFRGLVNISGFHVDPGFKGKLKFSVYNAGSHSIILDRGAPYFVLWISQLSSPLSKKNEYNGTHQGQKNITSEDIMKIKGEIASPNALLKKIKGLQSSFVRHWWLLGILFTISIGIIIRIYWQESQYEEGFNDGYNKTQIEDKVTNKVNLIINKKIDSVISAKLNAIKIVGDTIK